MPSACHADRDPHRRSSFLMVDLTQEPLQLWHEAHCCWTSDFRVCGMGWVPDTRGRMGTSGAAAPHTI